MTDDKLKLPFFVKVTILLVGLFALFTLLYIGQKIIVPVVFAIIISILLHPLVNFLTKHRIHRVVAIVFTIFLTFVVFAAFGSLVFSQASQFSESWPLLVEKFTALLNQVITWASGYFDISPVSIHKWITDTRADLMNISSSAIGQTLVIVGSGLMFLFLVPVYIFLILYYEPLLLDFVRKIFGESNKSQVNEIVLQIKTVIQRYLIGLFIEAGLIAIMEITALLILGVDYAILLGIIGALLNAIPYIGGIVAVALPMAVALVTKDTPLYAFYIMVIYYLIQLVDNNYIVPKIVASKVKINALFSIIVVFAGNALWGIPGMFLSIPLLAIIKLIFDHIEPLKPWGFLLGDTMPPILKLHPIIKKIIKKTK